jgi:hypothetical protein
MWSPMARFARERQHTMAQASGLVRDIDPPRSVMYSSSFEHSSSHADLACLP